MLYLTQIADRRFQFRISIYTIGILKGEFTMKDLRNPIERRNFTHPAEHLKLLIVEIMDGKSL